MGTSMKKIYLSLLFISASAFAQTTTPALEQYMQQLDCATAKALEQLDKGIQKHEAVASSASVCVPEPFVAEQGGLPTGLPAPTRAARIASLSDSAVLRLELCERSNVKTSACLKLFQK